MSTTDNTFPQMDTTLTFTKTTTRKVRYEVKYEMNYDEFFQLRQMGSGVIENSDKLFQLRVESEWQALLNSFPHKANGDAEIELEEDDNEEEYDATEEEVDASGIDCEDDAENYVLEFFSETDKERHEEFKSRQEEHKKYADEIAELKRRLFKYESV